MIKNILLGTALSLVIPFAASAQVVDAVQVDGFGLSLKYPAIHTQKDTVDTVINKDIRMSIDNVKTNYEKNTYDNVAMDYVTTFENANYVSIITNTTYQSKKLAHPENIQETMIFDKTTGQRVDGSKLANVPTGKDLVSALAAGKLSLMNAQGQKIKYDSSFTPEKASTAYFLTKEGQLAVLYPQGELAPSSDGYTYVVVPTTIK